MMPWLAYLLMVVILTLYYREYILGGTKRWMNVVKLLLVGFSVSVFLYYSNAIYYNIIRMPALYILTILVAIAAVLVFNTKRSKYSCKREEELEINGVKYTICYTDIINAWYNSRTKKIYVSSKLAEHLTDNEIKAVVYHEEGHARNRWLNQVSALLLGLWVFALAGIMIMLMILWKAPLQLSQSLVGISTMYAIASILTLTATVTSWIAEHESDRRALEMTSLESIANALVKVHVYGILEKGRLLEAVERCKTKNARHLLGAYQKISFASVFHTLLLYGFTFPKWIGEYLQKPVYYTHPPVQLRLALLLHHYSNQNIIRDKEE